MTNESGSTNWAAGVAFTQTVVLNDPGSSYFYRFRAYSGGVEIASQPQSPAPPQAGPQVVSRLSWAGTPGFETDAWTPTRVGGQRLRLQGEIHRFAGASAHGGDAFADSRHSNRWPAAPSP